MKKKSWILQKGNDSLMGTMMHISI